MRKKEEQYHPGKLNIIIQVMGRLIRDNPGIEDDRGRLMRRLQTVLPNIMDNTKCANCGTSMKIVTYTADLHDGLLILAMARKVRQNSEEGLNFTEANKVHMPTLEVSNTTSKRQTKCDYLGLIKQSEELRNTGRWVLTTWAWKLLKGEEIPRSAHYWQGQMQGRSEEATTLPQMFRTHVELVKRAIAHGRQSRSDYRGEIGDYSPSEWSEYYGTREGTLF